MAADAQKSAEPFEPHRLTRLMLLLQLAGLFVWPLCVAVMAVVLRSKGVKPIGILVVGVCFWVLLAWLVRLYRLRSGLYPLLMMAFVGLYGGLFVGLAFTEQRLEWRIESALAAAISMALVLFYSRERRHFRQPRLEPRPTETA